MKATTSVISSQGQVTLPASIRRQLGISPGSTIVWHVEHDRFGVAQVRLRPGTVAALQQLRGAAKRLYQKHGGAQRVLEEERGSWE